MNIRIDGTFEKDLRKIKTKSQSSAIINLFSRIK